MEIYTVEFVPKFTLPSFLFIYTEPGCEGSSYVQTIKKNWKTFIGNSKNSKILYLETTDVNPAPLVEDTSEKFIMVVGSPIVGDKIEKTLVLKNIFSNNNLNTEFLAGLNGEFLIFVWNKETEELCIINDRFTSYPFYYSNEHNIFSGSMYFKDMWLFKKACNNLNINQLAFFEFLWFQRILGTKTYLSDVFFLPDASILKVSNKFEISVSRYWTRNYTKSNLSPDSHAEQLAYLVRQSVKRKTCDNVRCGHFLSGGMDSRSVLAAFSENLPVCFTAAISENRELRTARKIALTKGAKHVFLKFGEHHYADISQTASLLIGGMYNFDHAIFLGYEDAVRSETDVCFHGHGFDYMFQGMYIPSERVKLFGRNLYLKRMKSLPDDLVSFFINNASYRTKGGDIYKYVKKDKIDMLKEFQRESVKEILLTAEELTDDIHDKWEFLTFHYISRHYSFPNHASIATYREQRVISFDNDIFDFYLSLPVVQRFDGKIEKRCLKILDSKLAKIPSANTGLPVTASCWKQTFYQIKDALIRRLLFLPDRDEWKERTWLKRDDVIREEKFLQNALEKMINGGGLEHLSWLDVDAMKRDIPIWLDGDKCKDLSGDILTCIITIGNFLQL